MKSTNQPNNHLAYDVYEDVENHMEDGMTKMQAISQACKDWSLAREQVNDLLKVHERNQNESETYDNLGDIA